MKLHDTLLTLSALACLASCGSELEGNTTGAGGDSTSAGTSSSSGGGGESSSSSGNGGFGGSASGSGGAASQCEEVIEVADPSTQIGTTVGEIDHRTGWCQAGGAPDVFYKVTSTHTGSLELELTSPADLGMHAWSYCEGTNNMLKCADDSFEGGVETMAIPVIEGQVVYIFVDGFSSSDAGPFELSIKSRPPICGNGVYEAGESCEPPGVDGCGPDCHLIPEICDNGIEDNMNGDVDCEDYGCAQSPACPFEAFCAGAAALMPTQLGDTSGGVSKFTGGCTGQGSPEALYGFTPPEDGVLELVLYSASDLGIYSKACYDPFFNSKYCVNGPAGGVETLRLPALKDVPLTIIVDGKSPMSAGPFKLDSYFPAFPLADVEPNNDPAAASPYMAPFYGILKDIGDSDYISVTVPGPSSSLTAGVTHIDGGCKFEFMTKIEILGANGAQSLAQGEGSSFNYCSSATAAGLAAGTYYIRVSGKYPDVPVSLLEPTALYQLKLTVE